MPARGLPPENLSGRRTGSPPPPSRQLELGSAFGDGDAVLANFGGGADFGLRHGSLSCDSAGSACVGKSVQMTCAASSSPCSMRSAMTLSAKARAFAAASSRVSPYAIAPGISIASAIQRRRPLAPFRLSASAPLQPRFPNCLGRVFLRLARALSSLDCPSTWEAAAANARCCWTWRSSL